MTLRCVRCVLAGNGLGDDAEYIYNGESLCWPHLLEREAPSK